MMKEKKIQDKNRLVNKTKKKTTEKSSTSSLEDIFETVKTETSIIKTLSDNDSKKKEENMDTNNKSFVSYKDVVLKKL